MISICKNELILCSRCFLSLLLCFWATSFLFSLSISFLLWPDSLSIRIILPKNSKSKCSIFPSISSVLQLCSVLRSFFSSAFRTHTHLLSMRSAISLRHLRTLCQLASLSLHHCALTASSFHLFPLDEYQSVCVCVCKPV